jgi:putative chitinase
MSISKSVVKAASGAKRDKYVDLFYDSLIKETSNYGVKSDEQLLSFLSQIGHETGGLYYVEELASGSAYEDRSDLGNTQPGDGVRYKGRGLIQLTGRKNYNKAGGFLGSDFEGDPSNVSPKNSEHQSSGGRTDQYDNAVKSALWFWRKGSAWGDLNNYASQIDLQQGLFIGDFDVNRLPEKTTEALRAPFNLVRKKGGKRNPSDYTGFFLVDYLGLDRDGDGKNLFMFELITLGINGGYNGFKDRYLKFEEGRKALLGDNYKEPFQTDPDKVREPDPIEEDQDEDEERDSDDGKDSDAIEQYESITGIQNIVTPTIKLDPVEFSSQGDEQSIVDIGKKPFVWLNDIQLDIITQFKLTSSGFLPTLKLTFYDKYSYFDNLRFPNDDGRVKVLIDPRHPLLRPIYCEFKIIKFQKIEDSMYLIEGMLNVNRMYVTKVESFNNSSSFETLKKTAILSNLGFSTNINETDDEMTWINPGNRVQDFCQEVVRRSYRSDSSFMRSFVDFFYNLNFIDIEEQLKFDISKQYGISTGGLNEIQKKLSLAEEGDANFIYLTNDQSGSAKPNYFETYKVFNTSTTRSIKQGYTNRVKYYDWKSKEFLIFDVDSINDDNNVILKSDDDEFLRENVKHLWEGKLLNNNAHDNYHYSFVQNKLNLNEIQKVGMEIILPNINFNLYRYMKVYILIVNQNMNVINPLLNKKLSGEWLIVDIEYFMNENEFKQKVRLIRRDLGFSQEEENE